MNKELKPCPFCGGEAATFARMNSIGEMFYGGMCKNTGCCLIPAVYTSESMAVEKWNRRTTDE